MGVGLIWRKGNGATDQIGPNVRPTYLSGNRTEMVHRQGVFRLLRQDLPVKLLGLRQPGILPVLHCQIERLANRQLEHSGDPICQEARREA